MCNKVLWLDHGIVKQFGSPNAVLEQYLSVNVQRETEPA
jgi:ABC-type polysaccharide/polyol phosphate transport system ATPase subunit